MHVEKMIKENRDQQKAALLHRQNHMFKLMSLLRVAMMSSKIKMFSEGECFIWIPSNETDNVICWRLKQTITNYHLTKVNHDDNYDYDIFHSSGLEVSPNAVAQKIVDDLGIKITIPAAKLT